jgi:hypothetical protein
MSCVLMLMRVESASSGGRSLLRNILTAFAWGNWRKLWNTLLGCVIRSRPEFGWAWSQCNWTARRTFPISTAGCLLFVIFSWSQSDWWTILTLLGYRDIAKESVRLCLFHNTLSPDFYLNNRFCCFEKPLVTFTVKRWRGMSLSLIISDSI